MCNVRLSGGYYCECVMDCPVSETSNNNALFALLVIPFVILIVVLVILIILLYRRRQTIRNRVRLQISRIKKKTCFVLFCEVLLSPQVDKETI